MLSGVKNVIKNRLKKSDFLLSNKTILLESLPDFADNTKYVYDELIRRGVNEKCKIYWFLYNDLRQYDKQKNVKFIKQDSFKARVLRFRAKFIVDSNVYIKKERDEQFRIFLGHGSPLKMAYAYLREAGDLDYAVVSSDYFIAPSADLHDISEDKFVTTGLPRCDGLLNDIHPTTPYSSYDKVIIWMPTYRNHRAGVGVTTGIHFRYGVPYIQNEAELEQINVILKKKNACLVIWRHPAEDASKIKDINKSNIQIFDQKKFDEDGIQLYDFLKDTDALITDYSSIYYDYLLTKNPIGIAAPDLDEYSKKYEFCGGDYKKAVKGYFLNNYDELVSFIKNVADGKLKPNKEQDKALNLYHKYQDGKNAKRVVDLLLKEMSKK